MAASILQRGTLDTVPLSNGYAGNDGTNNYFPVAFPAATTTGSTIVVFATVFPSGGSEALSACSDPVNGSYGTALDTITSASGNAYLKSWAFQNAAAVPAGDTGKATGGSATTLVDSSKAWATNQWAGTTVIDLTNNVSHTVVSNTSTTLTFASGTAVAAGHYYVAGGFIKITLIASGPLYNFATCIEVGSAATSGLVHSAHETAPGSSGTDNITSNAATCSSAGLMVGFAGNVTGNSSPQAPGAGTGFTSVATTFQADTGSPSARLQTQYFGSAPGSKAATWSSTGADTYPALMVFVPDASGGPTGSGATTEGADAVSAAGSTSTSGSAAVAEAHDTVAGTGSAGGAGTAAITEGQDAASGAGSISVSGSGAPSEAHDTVSGAGSISTSGSGATTEAHDSVAGVGQTPPTLATWATVRSAVAAGSRRARVLCLGDSLTAGYQSTSNGMGSNARSLSYPVQMAPRFFAAPAHADAWLADANAPQSGGTLVQYDTRITLGSGWGNDTADGPTANGDIQEQLSATSSSLAFTPANSLDNLTVWYQKYSGSPQYAVNVDGGSSLGTLPANATAAIGTASFSVTAGTHTINVPSNGTAGGKIFGMEAWSSSAPQIQIIVAGAGGWTAGDWTQNNGHPWDPLSFAEFLAPDLTLVCLGKNEQDQGISQATFQSHLSTLVSGLLNAGSPVVIFGPPLSSPGALGSGQSEAAQLAYETNMAAVAANLGCTFYSLTQSRANWSSFSAANSAGFMYSDGMHCTPAGYLDISKALLTLIDVVPAYNVQRSPGPGISPSTRFQFSSLIRDTKTAIIASGTAAIAENHDIAAGTGSTSATGSAAITESSDAVAGTGVAGGAGSAAITESSDTVVGSGGSSVSGSATVAEANDSVSGTGSIGQPGSFSQLRGPGPGTSPSTRFQFSSLIGDTTKLATSIVLGAGSVAEATDVVTGAGASTSSGVGAAGESPDVVSGAGNAGGAGSGAIAEAHDTAAGSGSISTSGSAAIAEPGDTVAAVGGVSISGTAGITEGFDSVTATGNVGGGGSGAALEAPDIAAGSGGLSVVGSGAAAEATDVVAGAGGVLTTGIAATVESADTVAASGNAGGSGSGAIHESADTASGTGSLSFSGSAAATEAADSVSGTGGTSSGAIGAAAITESPDTAAASGSLSVGGSAAIAEAADVAAGQGGMTAGPRYIIKRIRARRWIVSATTYLQFDPKGPDENVKLTFDFSPDLLAGVLLIGTPVVTYAVKIGTDLSPASMANGSPGFDISGTKVIVPVKAGVDGCNYSIHVRCGTSDPQLALSLTGEILVQS